MQTMIFDTTLIKAHNSILQFIREMAGRLELKDKILIFRSKALHILKRMVERKTQREHRV